MTGDAYRHFPGTKDDLLVVFGGIMLGFGGEPVFEFGRTTAGLDVHRLMLRDHRQGWYQRGLPGEGRDFQCVVDVIQGVVDDVQPRRTLVVGNSAGGYAALLAGHAVQADRILAVSPQTFIDPRLRKRHGDARWRRNMVRIGLRKRLAPTGDVLRYIDGIPPVETHIHYAGGYDLDALHAERMGIRSRMHLHRHDFPDHSLVERMGREGTLLPLLESLLE